MVMHRSRSEPNPVYSWLTQHCGQGAHRQFPLFYRGEPGADSEPAVTDQARGRIESVTLSECGYGATALATC